MKIQVLRQVGCATVLLGAMCAANAQSKSARKTVREIRRILRRVRPIVRN
jgi:hypothetical protein